MQRRASGDPAHDSLILRATQRELLTTAVRYRGGSLSQEQALLGCGHGDATPLPFLHQRIVIEGFIESEQTQFEAVLSFRLPVATARIAAGLRQDRLHFMNERDGSRLPQAGHGDGHLQLDRTQPDDDV